MDHQRNHAQNRFTLVCKVSCHFKSQFGKLRDVNRNCTMDSCRDLTAFYDSVTNVRRSRISAVQHPRIANEWPCDDSGESRQEDFQQVKNSCISREDVQDSEERACLKEVPA